MMFPAFWNEAWTAALANHLWQSTAVTGIAWLLSLSLRNNHARTRYWVWMIASVKYLIPFSLLIAAGESLRSASWPLRFKGRCWQPRCSRSLCPFRWLPRPPPFHRPVPCPNQQRLPRLLAIFGR